MKKRIDKYVIEHKVWIFLTAIIGIMAFLFYKYRWENLLYYELCAVSIAVFIVFVTMRVSISNKILFWLGKNLFPLYILQRLPMIILQIFELNETHIYLYGILCGICMIVLAIIFKLISGGVETIFGLLKNVNINNRI